MVAGLNPRNGGSMYHLDVQPCVRFIIIASRVTGWFPCHLDSQVAVAFTVAGSWGVECLLWRSGQVAKSADS